MKVLIISFSDLSCDPRVLRQIEYFQSRGDEVTTLGNSPSLKQNVRSFCCHIKRKTLEKIVKCGQLLGLYEWAYWNRPTIRRCQKIFPQENFDLIVVNDLDPLPLALKNKGKAKILYDAHEYAPLEFEDSFRWRLIHKKAKTYFCKRYLPLIDAMTTVCDGIAEEYRQLSGISSSLVYNTPRYRSIQPTEVPKDIIRMIYHGFASPYRDVLQVIDLMDLVDQRFHLDLILIPGCAKYIKQIQARARNHPRIRFLDPVPTEKISDFCNQYALGLFPLKAENFNYFHALPNKFFEFIQARIPPAVFPLPEMKRICLEYKCGFVSEECSIQSLASLLNLLTPEKIMEKKKACHEAAKTYCAEANWERMDKILLEVSPLP